MIIHIRQERRQPTEADKLLLQSFRRLGRAGRHFDAPTCWAVICFENLEGPERRPIRCPLVLYSLGLGTWGGSVCLN